MTWREALEINVAATGHLAYRDKCDDSHPKHESWRREMVRMATSPPSPSPAKILTNAVTAAGRVAGAIGSAIVHGEPIREAIVVDDVEADRRYAICQTCPHYLPATDQCGKCSCFLKHAKRWLKTESCPDTPDRWKLPESIP
jgi:hypothetical protein